MNTTPIKPTLQAMEVGRQTYFPRNRRKSVRTTASDLKPMKEKFLKLGSTEITFMLNAKNNTAMGRTRVTGKVEPIVKKWLSKDEAKSYIGCSDDFLRTLREKALVSFSQFGKMIWYDLSSIDRFIQSNKIV